EVIKREVKMFQEAGADGVVIGVLNPDGTLDIDRMNELIHIAKGMHITLHRAFDMCKNPLETLEQAKQLGINTILTSGQKNSCYDGKELIRELVNKSKGKVDILIGGGVKAEIIKEMYKFTKATSYHMSGKEVINSSMEYRKEEVSMGIASLSEYSIWQTSPTKISQVKDILEKLISN
uniref:copper homeostasis protein CutC n=1 Tax=Vallitalea guaymasensis TaxID=1185412 RepID=UPI00272CE511